MPAELIGTAGLSCLIKLSCFSAVMAGLGEGWTGRVKERRSRKELKSFEFIDCGSSSQELCKFWMINILTLSVISAEGTHGGSNLSNVKFSCRVIKEV